MSSLAQTGKIVVTCIPRNEENFDCAPDSYQINSFTLTPNLTLYLYRTVNSTQHTNYEYKLKTITVNRLVAK